MDSVDDFLAITERRTYLINDLSITPITIHEMMSSERDILLSSYNKLERDTPEIDPKDAEGEDISPQILQEKIAVRQELLGKRRTYISCEAILKAIFGYDKDFTEEQVNGLSEKYSNVVIDDIFDRVMNFNGLNKKAIQIAKKPL
jgi:hypothetical protein